MSVEGRVDDGVPAADPGAEVADQGVPEAEDIDHGKQTGPQSDGPDAGRARRPHLTPGPATGAMLATGQD